MMVDFRSAHRLFPVLIALLIFPSCAQMKSSLSPQASVQAPQASVQAPQASVQARSQARQYITAGEYRKAIDLYKAEYQKHPQDPVLVKEYVKSLEEIKTAADRASGREDFASAGKTYNILLKNNSNFKGFAHELSFDSAQLNLRLKNCKTALSRKGFQAYREGNLSEAISVWQDYLEIDPNNPDVKKALNTARMQQKNLQQTNNRRLNGDEASRLW
jgi:tetratricopeptide (TPR) repeat protein